MFNIVYYRTAAGRKPVREFIYELENMAQQAVFAAIDVLGEYGHELRRPFADVVRGKIRELRVTTGKKPLQNIILLLRPEHYTASRVA